MQVFIKTLVGKTFELEVEACETVWDLKRKFHLLKGVPEDQFILVHRGKQLEEGRELQSYGIQSSSTIHLVLRQRGGG